MVDPRKAEGKRLMFTIEAEGDPRIRLVELSNGVLVISGADSKAATHVDVSQRELAEFVLGQQAPGKKSGALAELDGSMDRSHLLGPRARVPAVIEPGGKKKYNDTLEHLPRDPSRLRGSDWSRLPLEPSSRPRRLRGRPLRTRIDHATHLTLC
jgi:hypothetical protein